MSAIYLAKNWVYHAQTKYIDVKFHSVRAILEESDLVFEKIYTKENLTAMLTQVVSGGKFNHWKNLLHILLVVRVRWSSFG